jgi:hypothetical protein
MKQSSQQGKSKATNWHTVSYKHEGKERDVDVELPADADSDSYHEAAQFVQTLEDNQQIAHDPGPLTAGTTHQIQTDKEGKKRLVRKRFSAI